MIVDRVLGKMSLGGATCLGRRPSVEQRLARGRLLIPCKCDGRDALQLAPSTYDISFVLAPQTIEVLMPLAGSRAMAPGRRPCTHTHALREKVFFWSICDVPTNLASGSIYQFGIIRIWIRELKISCSLRWLVNSYIVLTDERKKKCWSNSKLLVCNLRKFRKNRTHGHWFWTLGYRCNSKFCSTL
jgi:hypothetical protein